MIAAVVQSEIAPDLTSGIEKTRVLARTAVAQGMSALPSSLERHPDRSGEWALHGGSMVVGPDGKILARPVFEREAIITADLDLSRVREERMTLDVSGHYSRPDSFEFRAIRHARDAS